MKASIVIPSYNACERLFLTLVSLNQQDCDLNLFEVIVVNNGSTDYTLKMLADFKPKYKLHVITLPSVMPRAYGRNVGIEAASNEIIIFLDSDMLTDKSYVRNHLNSHTGEELVVCGKLWSKIYTHFYRDFDSNQKNHFKEHMQRYLRNNLRIKYDKQPILKEYQIVNGQYEIFGFDVKSYYEEIYRQYGPRLTDYHFKWLFFVTRSCSVNRISLIDIGLFDPHFTGWGSEDTDVGFRLYQKGFDFFVNENIKCFHQEHPKAPDIAHARDNRQYLISKHDSIDLLIYFLYSYIPIAANDINHVMNDIIRIRASVPHHPLVVLFQEALILLRDRVLNKSNSALPADFDIEQTNKQLVELSNTHNVKYFPIALSKLLKMVYNVSIFS